MIIVYDHPSLVIAYKSEGVNFHSEEEAGFVVQVSQQLGIPLFPVHRLDKMTSGLVILAKDSETAAQFGKMFEAREVEKYYLAISMRKPKKKMGWIKGDMASARRGDYKLLTTMENPAITQFISCALRTHERFFLIKPHTGKTHQIRVALKSLGSPIAGDERYAQADEARKEERGYLHAYALRFRLNDEAFEFVVPPEEGERFVSAECKNQLEIWNKPWELF
ncbi:MAG: TIGR01621 family pseudouridine synthase [Sulfuricurvum sp.]|uniref:TIGR01621 family pseudouridine synthase n=1 Tax=Sulfuricurvum sp. TaxID=2025608 RepID=UPI00262E89C4|nr:TIGR01621 family pseudouridine synthase [Sulfuricurvum sp.]MDD2368697.1 TIGR01621 family pseudouridine synthase [Sulfuricurvum sp.]MDD5118490.1 TIGR01621 family pseudouridine synthase [Sulfuricurvum sp.]